MRDVPEQQGGVGRKNSNSFFKSKIGGGEVPLALEGIPLDDVTKAVVERSDLRCDDGNVINTFKTLVNDYSEMKKAMGVGTRIDTANMTTETGTLAVFGAVHPGAHDGAAAAAGDSGSSTEEAVGGGGGTYAAARTKKQKQAKVDGLRVEVLEMVHCLSRVEWATLCCDKKMEGMVTRVNSCRRKFSDAGYNSHNDQLAYWIGLLNAIQAFGTAYKKHTHEYQESHQPGGHAWASCGHGGFTEEG